MPEVNVEASIEINASPEEIHGILVDYTTWPTWSPWLYIEPATSVTYHGIAGQIGHGYQWQSDKTGAGAMTLTNTTSQRIECDLQFLKPFKSQADVVFTLQPSGSSVTRVVWLMKSSLPFFMFWMKDKMSAMIRADYTRGLCLLKDYAETGHVLSNTIVDGVVDVDSTYYVGKQADSSLAGISSTLGKNYDELMTEASNDLFVIDGPSFCIYNHVDLNAQHFTYTAAIPCSEAVSVKTPLVASKRPACRALKVTHTGSHRHLANAWSMMMAEAKAMKLKPLKQLPPFEVYLNSTDTAGDEYLVTEVYLPVRA